MAPRISKGAVSNGAIAYQDDGDPTQFHYFPSSPGLTLDDNLKAAEVKLSAEDVRKLDDASAFDLGYPYKFIANIQKRW